MLMLIVLNDTIAGMKANIKLGPIVNETFHLFLHRNIISRCLKL